MSAKTISIITDSAKLDAAIAEVNKRANSLIDSLQLVLASAVFQAVAHGNVNHINAVHHAAGRGVRKTAMAQWLLKWAPVVLETDKEKAKEAPYRFSRDKLEAIGAEQAFTEAKKPTAEEATAYGQVILGHSWADHKEPPLVPESWSVTDALKKVLQTAKSMQTKKVDIKGGDLLSSLEALVAPKEQPAGL